MTRLKRFQFWVLNKLGTLARTNPDPVYGFRRRLLREDIEKMIETNGGSQGLDLTKCDLSRLDLRGIHLRGARLAESHFYLTDLRGSVFANCDLRQSSLHDAKLDYVDFYLANLENAHLLGASLIKANLNRANLLNARLPDRIREAIGDRLLQENEAEYERYLTEISRFVDEGSIAHRRALRFIEAANVYAALKNNLMSNGRYDEASWAYIRERQMRRKAFAPWRAMMMYNALESSSSAWIGSAFAFWVKALIKWISDCLAEMSCGYGERPLRTLGWSVTVILIDHDIVRRF